MSDEQASNYSIQPRYPFPQSPPMGALAAADSYSPTDWPAGPAELPDIGAPLVSPGPQVSAGAPWANRLVDTMTTPRPADDDNTVLYKTASPLVNFTQADINRGLDLGLSFSGGGLGIKAYHGSPHDFDRFDMSRIGTGEGAQAYGHGLYFAENEGVARNYRDALSNSDLSVAGQPYNAKDPDHWAAMSLHEYGGDAKKAVADLTRKIGEYKQINNSSIQSAIPAMEDTIARIKKGGLPEVSETPHGKMYEVNINADPAHFLDWDKPLKGQSEEVKSLLGLRPTQQLGPSGYLMKSDKLGGWHNPDRTGGDLYSQQQSALISAAREKLALDSHVAKIFDNDPLNVDAATAYKVLNKPSFASQTLHEAGIPGIKYLDQGSRASGEGSRNYVLFNDKLIDIMRKYGLAGAAPAGMGALAAQDNYPPQ